MTIRWRDIIGGGERCEKCGGREVIGAICLDCPVTPPSPPRRDRFPAVLVFDSGAKLVQPGQSVELAVSANMGSFHAHRLTVSPSTSDDLEILFVKVGKNHQPIYGTRDNGGCARLSAGALAAFPQGVCVGWDTAHVAMMITFGISNVGTSPGRFVAVVEGD